MVMANKRPEFQEKILLANLLAPVAFVDHMKSPIRLIAAYTESIEVSALHVSLLYTRGQSYKKISPVDKFTNAP